MKQFKSAGQAQRFLSAHDQINNLFHFRRDHVTAAERRASRTQNSGSGPKSVAWVCNDPIPLPVACIRLTRRDKLTCPLQLEKDLCPGIKGALLPIVALRNARRLRCPCSCNPAAMPWR
jgi:hypothetical protein